MKFISRYICFTSLGWVLLLIILFGSCHKDKEAGNTAQQSNHPPVANAGADITIDISPCVSRHFVELNGSNSYDPDYDAMNFDWKQISGPPCILSAAQVSSFLTAGQYVFELKVTDKGGLSSTDMVILNVIGSPTPIEYNVDIAVTCNYVFKNNYDICYEDFFSGNSICNSWDFTSIEGDFLLPSFGQTKFWANAYADTATSSYNHETQMGFYADNNATTPYIWGYSSIDFKKLIQTGGGPFNGTCKIVMWSAGYCDPGIIDNLNPLTITGNLVVTDHTINLTIKGKIYL